MLSEKYRPHSFDDMVGNHDIIPRIKSILDREKESGEVNAFMLLGPPGTGKTTTAECIARYLFGENWSQMYKEFNASDDRGIDVIRGPIKSIAYSKGKKVIVLDEMDQMTDDAQNALRRIMERTGSTVFILCGNVESHIIDPLKSRCVIFRFSRLDDKDILARLLYVCKSEGIKITSESKEAFKLLLREANGDMRKAFNILDKIITDKKELSVSSVTALQEIDVARSAIMSALLGDFERARDLIEDSIINAKYDPSKILEGLYYALDNLDEKYNNIAIRLYAKLADVDHALKLGGNPLFQFVGFLAFVWILPHLSEGCQLLEAPKVN